MIQINLIDIWPGFEIFFSRWQPQRCRKSRMIQSLLTCLVWIRLKRNFTSLVSSTMFFNKGRSRRNFMGLIGNSRNFCKLTKCQIHSEVIKHVLQRGGSDIWSIFSPKVHLIWSLRRSFWGKTGSFGNFPLQGGRGPLFPKVNVIKYWQNVNFLVKTKNVP